MSGDWDRARAVADAVLYEGYLLYPYRATSSKNQIRWQFGVLGPPGAAQAGLGEDDSISAQLLTRRADAVRIVVRFLQLQHRRAERREPDGSYLPVGELTTATGSWLTWDEAVDVESDFGPIPLGSGGCTLPIAVPDAIDHEDLDGGRLVRERSGLHGVLDIGVDADGDLRRLTVTVRNTGAPARDGHDALARSMIGAHVIAEALSHDGTGAFVSLLEPPADVPDAAAAVGRCRHHRCFPVLAGPPGAVDLVLISPIILYDHPEIAEQSRGALYDSTEIDEILTLRVMTMTDREKAEARATDSRAARVIDQCDAMSAEDLLALHGVLRDPHAVGVIPAVPDGVDWWDPLADNAVSPDTDAVLVDGVRVARGTRVRLRPSRRAQNEKNSIF